MALALNTFRNEQRGWPFRPKPFLGRLIFPSKGVFIKLNVFTYKRSMRVLIKNFFFLLLSNLS